MCYILRGYARRFRQRFRRIVGEEKFEIGKRAIEIKVRVESATQLCEATFCGGPAVTIRIFNYESSVFNYDAMLFNYESLLFLPRCAVSWIGEL